MDSPGCRWVRSVLPAYMDGELKESTAAAVRQHLAHCPTCAARARMLAESWNLLDEVEPPPIQDGFTDRMMARIAAEKAQGTLAEETPPSRLRQAMASVAGIAAGLLVGLGLYAWSGYHAEPASPVEREVSRSLTFL